MTLILSKQWVCQSEVSNGRASSQYAYYKYNTLRVQLDDLQVPTNVGKKVNALALSCTCKLLLKFGTNI